MTVGMRRRVQDQQGDDFTGQSARGGGILRIGEVAQHVGVSTSILRYYEGRGLLPPAARDSCGYRVYRDSDLERIRFVTGARRLGFSFGEIREVMAVRDAEEAPCPRVLELITQKVVEVGQRISLLKSMQNELSDLHNLAQAVTRGRRDDSSEYEVAE
jgi:DNA-binding transcriptional MerR regulator